MMNLLPRLQTNIAHSFRSLATKKMRYLIAAFVDFLLIAIILTGGIQSTHKFVEPLISPLLPLHPLSENKNQKQVFGFAPYWNINKLEDVDFKVLTTLAYFGVEIDGDGKLLKDSQGYETFKSKKATDLFKKAHANGVKVVLTLTQMKNSTIKALMDDPEAQKRTIEESVNMVKQRGIDGLNIDIEYTGDPGQEYRDKFSNFVAAITQKMHQEVPLSRVTVSMYASSAKEPKIYDVASIGKSADGIFMMAYDFAVAGSDNAIPTSPLHGHESGEYWYDVATAVDDFLKLVSADKLILGVPYYGYDYLVYEPNVKAETRPAYSWRGEPYAQTYTSFKEHFNSNPDEYDEVRWGWDEAGKVGYVAYHITSTDTWRMLFMEDTKSLGLKYDLAKEKNLAGVGMWALGNDEGNPELWALLEDKFGSKSLANNETMRRKVGDLID